MTTRSILNRGSFLASVAGLAILPLHARAAAKYACPPCGCASDGLLFDRPGPCPSCGMALVASAELQHSVERAQFPPGVDRVQSPFELLANAISVRRCGIFIFEAPCCTFHQGDARQSLKVPASFYGNERATVS